MTDSAKHFVTTRWTRVVRSKGGTEDAQAALAELCETYYAQVRAFVRSRTRDGDKADDLTQEFFARVLRGGEPSTMRRRIRSRAGARTPRLACSCRIPVQAALTTVSTRTGRSGCWTLPWSVCPGR